MVGDRISKGQREDTCSQEGVLRVRKASSYGVGWLQRTYISLKDVPFYLKGAVESLEPRHSPGNFGDECWALIQLYPETGVG